MKCAEKWNRGNAFSWHHGLFGTLHPEREAELSQKLDDRKVHQKKKGERPFYYYYVSLYVAILNTKATQEDSQYDLREREWQISTINKKENDNRANCVTVKMLQSIEREGEKRDTIPKQKVKWQSVGGNSPNINHLLISGWSRERGRKEIAQLVLHPSSVWIGCQLETGNIRLLIFSTGWRGPEWRWMN